MGNKILLLIVLLVIGCAQKEIVEEVKDMGLKLTSPAFENNGNIPSIYTCQGQDINPELNIKGIPEQAKSLVLIIDDPDAPMGTWDHWVMWNMPVISKIDENSVPSGAIQGKNSWAKNGYGGPCPPSATHSYAFKLYALDTTLNLDSNSDKKDAEKAMQGHILDQTKLIGKYSKG